MLPESRNVGVRITFAETKNLFSTIVKMGRTCLGEVKLRKNELKEKSGYCRNTDLTGRYFPRKNLQREQ